MILFKELKLNDTAKKLLANFSYLSILEILGLALPIVTYPYLFRTIGAERYGVIVYAQAIVAYIVIVVNFGYNVSATRRVSENRNNITKLKQIYTSVVFSKSIIFLFSCILFFAILYFTNYKYSFVVVALLGLCVQEVLFPTWMYQGLEKMKFITIITFASKCSFVVLMFLLIHNEDDYIYVPFLYSFGGIITSLFSMIVLYKQFGISFVKISKSQIKGDFKESFPFFASRLSSVVMERSNVLVIGMFFSYEMVSIYDLCTKIVSVLKTPFSLVSQVVYPHVAKDKNMTIIIKLIRPLLVLGVSIALVIMLLSKYIVLFFGGDALLPACPILSMMVWYVPIVCFSYLFGASVLVVKGYAKEYNLSVVYSVVLYLLLMGLLLISKNVNLISMTLTFIIPEFFVALYRLYITKKYKLLTNK